MLGENRKRGRPAKDGSKRNRLNIRLTDEQLEQINFICDKKGVSATSAILEGINLNYNLTKYSDL